ncbi:MAG: hypothetical protein WBK28_01370 [Minisyncoccia bacterium]
MPESKPTQAFVPIQEIRNGVIILKDGTYRGILMCSSINFALKSEDEQKAIIGGFQNFLNSIDFSIEIVVHSRKMDIRPYLALLEQRMSVQKTELMQIQLREYMAFIKNFMEGADIMSKLFYIVVPFDAGVSVGGGLSLFGKKEAGSSTGLSASFNQHRVQLEQRMVLVSSGLMGTGLRAVPLGTEEAIELFYRSFNLGTFETPIKLAS